VRYWFNHRKYTALLSVLRPEQESSRPSNGSSEAAKRYASEGGVGKQGPPTGEEQNEFHITSI